MSLSRAVVLIDHHHALVLQFDADGAQSRMVKEHTHDTRQHGSAVRTEHEFFGEVGDALAGIDVACNGIEAPVFDFQCILECPGQSRITADVAAELRRHRIYRRDVIG